MSSFLRALADNYITVTHSQPPDLDTRVMGWEGGLDRNGIWYRWRIVEAIGTDNGDVTMYAREDWRVLPDDYTTDPHKAETYADGIVTWEASIEVHTKPEEYSGWGRVEEWHRCMREIMTAARASMRYTEADGWPEVEP